MIRILRRWKGGTDITFKQLWDNKLSPCLPEYMYMFICSLSSPSEWDVYSSDYVYIYLTVEELAHASFRQKGVFCHFLGLW